MKNLIGIMQGRLSPMMNDKIQSFPWDSWEEEFFLARDVGLDIIDWVAEADGFENNPLCSGPGIDKIRELVLETGVAVGAICAHYFVQRPFFREEGSIPAESVEVLENLIDYANRVGARYLEIPLLENSDISDKKKTALAVQIVGPAVKKAYEKGVILSFETSLPPLAFRTFLSTFNHPAVKATYDMGNSASLGYNPREEWEAYGDSVATVHVKDRLTGGGTVPLGMGNTDFAGCFSILKASGYTGPLILEVVREEAPVVTTRKNLEFVKKWLN